MSVTRIEGTRPLEAAQAHTTLQPRVPGEAKKVKETERKPPAETPEPPPEPRQPYAVSFSFQKDLNRVVIKIIDAVSGEPILEIPPESVIEALKQRQHRPGRLVDEEA